MLAQAQFIIAALGTGPGASLTELDLALSELRESGA